MSSVLQRWCREALLENFTVLPLEVLKVLCAKVCYLDVPTQESFREHFRVILTLKQGHSTERHKANGSWKNIWRVF